MNKLEEYKDKWGDSFGWEVAKHNYPNGSSVDSKQGVSFAVNSHAWKKGFDAAIALDLPVKFAEWQRHPNGEGLKELLLHFGYYPSMTEKYQYWIDNVYKPE